jgi:hypothetical protein
MASYTAFYYRIRCVLQNFLVLVGSQKRIAPLGIFLRQEHGLLQCDQCCICGSRPKQIYDY